MPALSMEMARRRKMNQASRPDATEAPSDTLPQAAARFLTRQPLLDGDYRVMGYEMAVKTRIPLPVSPGAASARQVRDEALLANVMELHRQQALSRRFTLLELDPLSLGHPLIPRLPKENVILAVNAPETSPALMAQCQALARDGFALAMDDTSVQPGLLPLARECRYLRLDVGDQDLMALCDRLVKVQGIRGPRLIATNVQTEEAFQACRKLHFDLYQGYFFTQPGPAPVRSPDASRLRVMSLLNLVVNHADHDLIEAEFKQDPALAYRLLRFINSPAVGLRFPVRSISHALLMLGHDPLYRWLVLLLFAHPAGHGRAMALLKHALARARLMENLGLQGLDAGQRGGLFIVGILSMLDALLAMPMTEALAPLRLAPPIQEALVEDTGVYAPYLMLARACETGALETLETCSSVLDLAPEAVLDAHIQALIWSEEVDL